MYVSRETAEQTDARLRRVIAAANLRVFEDAHYFREVSRAGFRFDPACLAAVRDEEVWSELVPVPQERDGSSDVEPFGLFSFHFPDGVDNSGFVGWLASAIKARTGAGVFVVCGQNSARGGVFDYWGCPLAEVERVLATVAELRGGG